jgi:hypothetical protein
MRTANPKSKILLVLLCLASLAAPLAAHDARLRVNPPQPYDNDFVTLYIQVTLDSLCYVSQGLHEIGNSFELRLVSCPFFAPPGPGPVDLAVEVGSLPPGTYQLRVVFDRVEIAAHTFTVRDALGTCEPAVDVLCLGDRRFAAKAAWQANGQQGMGRAANITRDTGRFTFFQPGNIELVVKVIDGCPLNGHFWVFAGGLTNVHTVLTVTDTTTDATRTYENPAGTPFAPVQDSAAFPCP